MQVTSRVCKVCKVDKPFSELKSNKTSKYGKRELCIKCASAYGAQWDKANPGKRQQAAEAFKERHPEDKFKEYNRKYRETHRGAVNARVRAHNLTRMNRAPVWLSDSEHTHIRCLYQLAQMRSRESGQKWHVDHIVPLQGKKVCGLHVPWNLRVIPAKENLSKNNRFDPI